MKTDDITDLILKGHFEDLRKQVSKMAIALEEPNPTLLLWRCKEYLTRLRDLEILNNEGMSLLDELVSVQYNMSEIADMPKMPMKKANRSDKVKKRKKAS